MTDQQSAEPHSEPATTIAETDRAYHIPNTSWDMSSGAIQQQSISDPRYQLPQVNMSSAWGGSIHLPALLPGDGYNPRVEPVQRPGMHPPTYTRSGVQTDDNYGSSYHPESYRRMGLSQGIDYRVDELAHSACRSEISSEEYPRTSTGQGSYCRNYVSSYADSQAVSRHESPYRNVPDNFTRVSIEQEHYSRPQSLGKFYLRSNPDHKMTIQTSNDGNSGYDKGISHRSYSGVSTEPEDYSRTKPLPGSEVRLIDGVDSRTSADPDPEPNVTETFKGDSSVTLNTKCVDSEDVDPARSGSASASNSQTRIYSNPCLNEDNTNDTAFSESGAMIHTELASMESLRNNSTDFGPEHNAVSTYHDFQQSSDPGIQTQLTRDARDRASSEAKSDIIRSCESDDTRDLTDTSHKLNMKCTSVNEVNKTRKSEDSTLVCNDEVCHQSSEGIFVDRMKHVTASERKEISLFKVRHPDSRMEDITEHFSKKWKKTLWREVVQEILESDTTTEVQKSSEITEENLPSDIRKAIVSYRSANKDVPIGEIINYFTRQWHVSLNEDLISRIVMQNQDCLEADWKSKNKTEESSDEKRSSNETAEQGLSLDMKKNIVFYKQSHQNVKEDEIAAHFRKQWCIEVTEEIVRNILNEHNENLSDISQNSPNHHNAMDPLCTQWRNTAVTSSVNGKQKEGGNLSRRDAHIAKLVPVTVEEAREGLMKAIAYFMANPLLADGHIQTLWNILKYIDTHDENGNISEKDGGSDNEISSQGHCSELVKIKQEVFEADNSDELLDNEAAENIKPENGKAMLSFRSELRPGRRKTLKSRSVKYGSRSSVRRKFINKKQVMGGDEDSVTNKCTAEDEINPGAVKVDVNEHLQCPECDHSFSEFTQLLDHITGHSEEKLLLGHECRDVIPGNKLVLRSKARGRGRQQCLTRENLSQNTEGQSKAGALPRHKQKIKLQNCTLCGRQFNDYSNFRRHMRLHAGLKPHKCPTCEVSFIESNALKKHMRTHTGEKPFLCTTCGKCVTTLAGLQSHARLHTGEKPFKCNVCEKDFAQSSSLKRHMVVHTGERPYSCPQCGKNFPRSEDLKMHIRTHTGQKPYKCLVCGKCFIKSSYLHKHSRIHTGEKPYKCTTCGEAFAQSDILAKHIRVHTGERPYCCTVCGKTFTQSGSLYHHMKMHKQREPNPTKQKVTVSLPEPHETNLNTVSEALSTSPQAECIKPDNSSAEPQMRVFSNPPRHYLSQWRPY